MILQTEIIEIMDREADSRGRITLGSEYAEKTVKVAIVEVEEDE